MRHAALPLAADQSVNSRQERAVQEAFPLLVAVAKKDSNLLLELWNNTNAWNEYHLLRIVR